VKNAERGARRELGPMMRMAAPLALAELGWMAMGLVDTIMAGRLGAAAVGAGGLGAMLFYPIAICGTGLLLGMDTLVSQAFGAEDVQDCRRTLISGLWLAVLITPPLVLVLLALTPVLRVTGSNPNILALFGPFVKALTWGILPLLFYTAFRRYLQAVNIVKPVTFALVSANIVNVVGNWVLMFGHWGAPAMGLEGSGWSTSVSRVYMAAVLLATILWHEHRSSNLLFAISWQPAWDRILGLVKLGIPAAGQILVEGAVFGLVTVFASRLAEAALAAHVIAVNVVATTYMVPLGISSAAAVRVGQAFGAKDWQGVVHRGWTALALGACFMASAGLVLATVPRFILRIYTVDASVVVGGAGLLRIAALFQLFDGLQVVATGALRGLGDTRTPLMAHFAGYWIIGLPVAYLLCFPARWGAPGIWVGLSAALIAIGLMLVTVWRWRTRELG
jgi:MATE family multidrug resistance protein